MEIQIGPVFVIKLATYVYYHQINGLSYMHILK